ncbi:MAG TPA: hypothetical protein VLA09_13390, partial [Longimicrobiales bacterium]|nr:hypothetical protein [Longimicrobiales bacterium]
MSHRPLLHGLGASLVIGLAALPLRGSAQEVHPPNRGGMTVSMGVPPTWHWNAGFQGRTHRRPGEAQVAYYGSLGLYRDLLNPMTASLGVMAEGYFGQRGAFEGFIGGLDGGGRIGLFSPVLRLAFGADYNVPDREADFFVSFIHPLRRGGFFVGGGSAWIDYLPGRSHSAGIGVRLPFGQKFLGRTRARRDRVRLADRGLPPLVHDPVPEVAEAIANARESARWINRTTVPFTDHWTGDRDESMARFVAALGEVKDHLSGSSTGETPRRPRTPVMDVEAYHGELERAFSIAVSGRPLQAGRSTPLGVAVADQAREILLEQVLLPYDRL